MNRLLPALTAALAAALLALGPGAGPARADDPGTPAAPGPQQSAPAAPSSAPAAQPAGGTPAQPQQPGSAQTFGIQPATDGQPDTRGAFTYSATPGATLKDQVAVANYSDQPLTLQLYAADAFNTDTGGYDVLAAGKPSSQAGSWLRTGTDQLTLPAHSQQVFPFTLAVPADASPGDHPAGIVVALRRDTKDAKGNTVTVDQRVGARVNLRVSGDLRADLRVEDVRTVYHPSVNPIDSGHTTISYTVRNAGNVRLAGRQAVRVTNAFGTLATSAGSPDLQELLPGNTVRYHLEVSGAYPTLWSTAGITVDPLAVAGDRDPKLSSSTEKHRFASIPWALLAVLVPALALAEFAPRRRRPAPGGGGVGAAPGADPDAAPGAGAGVAPAAGAAPAAVVTGGAALALLLLALTAAGLAGGPRAVADAPAASPAASAPAASAPAAPVVAVPGLPGTLAFDYPTGHDDDPVDLLTSGPCPHPTVDYLTVRITGAGFPAEGAPLNGTAAASIYHVAANGGYVLPLATTLRTVATGHGVTELHGPYTLTASCRGRVNPASVLDFTGVLNFDTPTTWQTASVAPDGVIHAANAEPAPGPAAALRSAPVAARPAPASGTPTAAWVAMGLGALLLGWIGLPHLRGRRRGAGAAAAAGTEADA
ncbi:WxL protein peptidoglycan domain-containing protein [Kitasatospora nipponensis]